MPAAARVRVLAPLLVAAAFILVAWVLIVCPMSNERAPLNVSSCGMAGSVARA